MVNSAMERARIARGRCTSSGRVVHEGPEIYAG
jgi:hypothetical protein